MRAQAIDSPRRALRSCAGRRVALFGLLLASGAPGCAARRSSAELPVSGTRSISWRLAQLYRGHPNQAGIAYADLFDKALVQRVTSALGPGGGMDPYPWPEEGAERPGIARDLARTLTGGGAEFIAYTFRAAIDRFVPLVPHTVSAFDVRTLEGPDGSMGIRLFA
jgi:hypothetical protein